MSGNGGGVRNLRAMFENNSQPASPDVRGRSPSARRDGDTSRPLSKVRTNFVSVEPIKRTPRNDTPEQQRGDSEAMHRRESFSLDESKPGDAKVLAEIKKVVSGELQLRKSNSSVKELVPENAIASETQTPYMGGADKQLGYSENAAPSVTSTSISRATSESVPDRTALDSSPPQQAAKDAKSGFSPSPRVMRNLADNLRTPKPAGELPEAPLSPTPAARRTSLKKPTTHADANGRPKPQASSEVKSDAAVDDTSTTASAKSPAVKEASIATAGAERSNRTESRTASGTITTGGFVKPKPRSPTRPIKLPDHLIAHTASSSAKHGDSPPAQKAVRRRSSMISTTSGTITTGGFIKPRPRSPTRPIKLPAHLVAHTASSSAKHGESPPAQRTLSRRSSTISDASRRPSARLMQRPSVPLLPRKTQPKPVQEQPEPEQKSPSATPSSFLERMMRPTQSSASKVKDKIGTATTGKK